MRVLLSLFDTQNMRDNTVVREKRGALSKLFIPSSPFIVLFHAAAPLLSHVYQLVSLARFILLTELKAQLHVACLER